MSMASMSVSKTDGPGSSPGAPANISVNGFFLLGNGWKILSGQRVGKREMVNRG